MPVGRFTIPATIATIAARCLKDKVTFKQTDLVGLPVEEMTLNAQRYDLIVMPRHEPDDTDSIEEGSTAALWAILRTTPRPVVAVPDQVPPGEAIVIAYDGSLQAARGVRH